MAFRWTSIPSPGGRSSASSESLMSSSSSRSSPAQWFRRPSTPCSSRSSPSSLTSGSSLSVSQSPRGLLDLIRRRPYHRKRTAGCVEQGGSCKSLDSLPPLRSDAGSQAQNNRPTSLPVFDVQTYPISSSKSSSSAKISPSDSVYVPFLASSPVKCDSPYRSRWDTGEIDLVNSDKPIQNYGSSLSSSVKPKIINYSSGKEKIALINSRPLPYPGKLLRNIDGHCFQNPLDNKAKSNLAIPSSVRCNRRRSRSFTPERSLLRGQTLRLSRGELMITSPHRLSRRVSSSQDRFKQNDHCQSPFKRDRLLDNDQSYIIKSFNAENFDRHLSLSGNGSVSHRSPGRVEHDSSTKNKSPVTNPYHRHRSPSIDRSIRHRSPCIDRSRRHRSPSIDRSRRHQSHSIDRSIRLRSPCVDLLFKSESPIVDASARYISPRTNPHERHLSPSTDRSLGHRSPISDRSLRQQLRGSDLSLRLQSPSTDRSLGYRSPSSDRSLRQQLQGSDLSLRLQSLNPAKSPVSRWALTVDKSHSFPPMEEKENHKPLTPSRTSQCQTETRVLVSPSHKGNFEEAWRKEKLWGKKRGIRELLTGTKEQTAGTASLPAIKRKFLKKK